MKWSVKHSTLIIIFFVSIFVGVFTINALCDLEIIDYAPNLVHNHDSQPEQSIASHHQEDHDHGHHDHDQTSSKSEEPCCEDITSQLESSLYSKIIKNQIVDTKFFLLGAISFGTNIISQYKSNSIIYHEYDTPPPLDGFSIRVLFQSFLN